MAGRYARVDDNYDRAEQTDNDFYAPEIDENGNYRKKRQKGGSY
jgi:hypothetical protein